MPPDYQWLEENVWKPFYKLTCIDQAEEEEQVEEVFPAKVVTPAAQEE